MTDQHPSTSTAGLLGGRYRLRHVIARGGMATVHRATDELLQRDVAVKVLHEHLADDPAFLDRFRREARAAAALSHPNVVAIFDCDETEAAAYMVMELVEGMSLREVLRTRGRLTPGEALALLAPAAAGLAAAHDAGLVHRDVKPENVLLSRGGVVKVTDFGLARAAAASTHTFGPGAMAGSPHYVAPEAVEGGTVDARADVYALGILLYECLVGRPPFEGDSAVTTALQHTRRTVPPPSEAVDGVDPDLDAVVRRATAPGPGDRFADGAEFAAALHAAVPEGPSPVDLRDGSTDTVVMPLAGTETVVHSPREAGKRPRGRRWGRRLRNLLVALLVAAGTGFGVWATVIAPVQPVPEVRGSTVAEATAALQQAGFEAVEAGERPNAIDVPEGRVLRTDPADRARRGSTVGLVLSAGPQEVDVPQVTGQDEPAARALLTDQGLLVRVERVFHEEVEAGLAVGTDPPAGSTVNEASTVTLLISKGREPIAVPDLVGVPEQQALEALREQGLDGTVAERRTDPDVPAGRVLGQEPAPAEILHRGETVNLVVSEGPETFPMPDVVGEPENKAVKRLEDVGLVVTVIYRNTIFGRAGRVASQDPPAGSEVVAGDEVTLRVWE